MYGGIMLVPRERHKMKQKTDKTILIIIAILFIFFEPAIVVNRYMTCALFTDWILKKKTQYFLKKPQFWKKSEFKKDPEFWKTYEFWKKTPEFWKKSELKKKKNLSFEKIWILLKKLMSKGKTWALAKENIVGMKIKPQT